MIDSGLQILATGFGEQSGIYKAAFAASKAFAIAQSLVSIQQGIAMAAANPFPYNIAAMASVAAATASIVSNLSAIAGTGFASGGFTGQGGKYQPAGIVHKGEYVLTRLQPTGSAYRILRHCAMVVLWMPRSVSQVLVPVRRTSAMTTVRQ